MSFFMLFFCRELEVVCKILLETVEVAFQVSTTYFTLLDQKSIKFYNAMKLFHGYMCGIGMPAMFTLHRNAGEGGL